MGLDEDFKIAMLGDMDGLMLLPAPLWPSTVNPAVKRMKLQIRLCFTSL